MKKLDELKFLLVFILAINQTSEHSDSDIINILDYSFRKLYGLNTNLLSLACVVKTKDQIMPEVQKILGYTQFKKYLDRNHTNPNPQFQFSERWFKITVSLY